MADKPPATPVKNALVGACVVGVFGALFAALSMANWSAWLIEISGDRTSSAMASILGRQGLMMAETTASLGFSLVAVLLVALLRTGGQGLAIKGYAGIVAGSRVLFLLVLVGGYWDRGWYQHLAHDGPKLLLGCSLLQTVLFVVAAVSSRRA